MEANVTGVERAEEQRFQHARDCEGNQDSDNHTKQRTRPPCTTTIRRPDDLSAPSGFLRANVDVPLSVYP